MVGAITLKDGYNIDMKEKIKFNIEIKNKSDTTTIYINKLPHVVVKNHDILGFVSYFEENSLTSKLYKIDICLRHKQQITLTYDSYYKWKKILRAINNYWTTY